MVRGLEKFREYFTDYPDSYIIIGGTALDRVICKLEEKQIWPLYLNSLKQTFCLIIHKSHRNFPL
jgi:hypothetical protein